MACSVKKGLANWGIGTAFCKAGIDYGVQGEIKALPLRKKPIPLAQEAMPSDWKVGKGLDSWGKRHDLDQRGIASEETSSASL